MTLSKLCESGNHNLCFEAEADCQCDSCHLICGECEGRCKVLYNDRCANCERALAKKTPFKGYPCDDCGVLGAFRNPHSRANVYRCTPCHAKSGTTLALPGNVGTMVMSGCAHLELTDPGHEFLKLKASRYRCQRCHQDVFIGQGGFSLKDINVVGDAKSAV